MTNPSPSPVALTAVDGPGQPPVTPELEDLYRGFEKELLVPLWTEIGDLMPPHPRSQAQPHRLARGTTCCRWPARAGELVPGRPRRRAAGDRAGQPGLGGRPFATPTLWAAIQYLMPGEDAPEHRHTQNAFRFVVEGEGVWTVVERRPGARCAAATSCPRPAGTGTPTTTRPTQPMAWIDGLDIPFQYAARDASSSSSAATRSARPSGSPRPVPLRAAVGPPRPAPALPAADRTGVSPLLAYRWEHTDRALADQLALEDEGIPAHRRARPRRRALHQPRDRRRRAADDPRRVPPDRPRHRDRAAAARPARRSTRSSTAPARSRRRRPLDRSSRGDLFVVPSWQPLSSAPRPADDSDSGGSTSSGSATPPSSRRCTCTAPTLGGRPMKLATIRTADGRTAAVRVDGDDLSSTSASADVGALLARPDWRDVRGRSRRPAAPRCGGARPRPGRAGPSKVVCVGLNYRNHIQEMGRDLPDVPDAVRQVRRRADRRPTTTSRSRPRPTRRLGGRAGRRRRHPVRRASDAEQAEAAIAGFTVLNDITCATGSSAPGVAAGQDLGLHHPGRPCWSPLTSSAAPPGAGHPVRRWTAQVMQRSAPPTCSSPRRTSPRTSPRSRRWTPATSSSPVHPGGVGAARDPKVFAAARPGRTDRDGGRRGVREHVVEDKL